MKRTVICIMLIFSVIFSFHALGKRKKKEVKPRKKIRVKRTIDKPESEDVGCVMGTFRIHLTDPFSALKAGVYFNNALMVFKDKKEKRDWKTFTAKVIDGVFYVENLPPGEYSLIRFRFTEEWSGTEVSIFYDFENFDFKILPGTITTLDDITAKPKKIKRSFSRYVVVYDFKEEDPTLLRKFFYSKIDRHGYWANYDWRQHSDKKRLPNFAESKLELINNLILGVETDFHTVKRFMENKEYQLAVIMGHRILKDLLKASFVYNFEEATVNDEEIPQTDDLKALAEAAKLELSLDQILFLADVTTYNKKVKEGDLTKDEERYLFSEKWTKTYISNIQELKEYIVTQTDTTKEVEDTEGRME